jgi:hypothetical protein
MPLGHVYAEAALPRPDWGSFMLGCVVPAVAGGEGAYVPLQHKRYISVTGRDRSGQPLTVSMEWIEPGDEAYEEATFFLRFVNRRGLG